MNSSTFANAGNTLKNVFQVNPVLMTIRHFNFGKSSLCLVKSMIYYLPMIYISFNSSKLSRGELSKLWETDN